MGEDSAQKKPKVRRRPPLWQRIVWRLCLSVLLLVFLVVAMVLALPLITNSGLVKAIVENAIAGFMRDAAVEIKTLRVAPLGSRLIVIEGLQLAPREQPDRPVVSIDRAVCEWSPLNLRDGELTLVGIAVKGVSVRIEESEGRWNVEALFPAEGEPLRMPDFTKVNLPVAIELGAIRVEDLTIEAASEAGERLEVGPISGAVFASFDNRLKGAAGFSCVARRLSARMPAPVEAEFETGFEVHAHLSQELGTAKLKGGLATYAGRASVAGLASRTPIATSGDMSATIDLMGLAVPEGHARFTAPGVLEDRLDFSVAHAEGWKLTADNSLLVDLSALAPGAHDAPTALRTGAEAAPVAHLRSLSLSGGAKVQSRLEAALSPGPPLRLRALLDNSITGSGVGFATQLRLPQIGPDGLEAEAGLSGLDVLWHYAAAVAIEDKLAVCTTDDFSLGFDTLHLAAGEFGGIAVSDVLLRGTAADHLPDPFNIAVSAQVSAGSIAVESPMVGRVEFPVELALEIRGHNLADAAESVVTLERITASVGAVAPRCSLEGVIEGYGLKSLCLGGGAVVSVEDALRLADGLREDLKAMLAGVDVEGAAFARFDVSGALPDPEGQGGLDVTLDAAATLPRADLWRGELGGSAREVEADLACAARLGADWMPLAVRARTNAAVGIAAAVAGEATAGLEGAAFALSATSDADLTDVSCKLESSARGITVSLPQQGGALFELGPLDAAGGASLSANIPQAELDVSDISCLLQGLAVRLTPSPDAGAEGVPYELGPLDVEAHASARSSLARGYVSLEDVSLRIPGVANLTDALLTVEEFGAKHATARAELDLPDLSAIAAMLPARLRVMLPQVSGAATVKCEADGRIPPAGRIVTALREGVPPQALSENLISSLRHGEPWPELRLLPLRRFYESAVPLSASGTLELRDISVRHRINDQLSVAVEGLSTDAGFSLKHGALEGEGALSLPVVRLSPLPWPIRDISLAGRCTFAEFDRLQVQDAAFSVFGGTLACGMDGEVSGLAAVQSVPTPASLLSTLSASGSGWLRVDPAAISALEGWTAGGGAGAQLSLALRAGESLDVEGLGQIEDLNVTRSGLLDVVGLTGQVGLAKHWRIMTQQEAEQGELLSNRVLGDVGALPAGGGSEAAAAWEQQGLGPALDQLGAPGERLTVRSVSLLGHDVLEDLSASIRVEGESLRVPGLSLDALGGRIVGRAGAWRAGDAYEVRMEGEFDGIDVRRLLPPRLRDVKGDASLSGNLHAQAALRAPGEGAPANPIKEISGELVVTHVGAKALDRALLFMDPEAENPGIVMIRTKLPLAGPRSGRIVLRRGFISGEVELQGLLSRLVSSYSLPRFSIAEAFATETAGKYLSQFTGLMSMARAPLQVLGSESIGRKEDGGVELGESR